MSDSDHLPDDAIVVRGGLVNQDSQLRRKARRHPAGIFGLSVHSAPNKSVVELVEAASTLWDYGRVGVTTVGTIRAAGYDVIPTSGIGFHATLRVPDDWSVEEAASLAHLFRDEPNPGKRKKGE